MEIKYDPQNGFMNIALPLDKTQYDALQNITHGRFDEIYTANLRKILETSNPSYIRIQNNKIEHLDLRNPPFGLKLPNGRLNLKDLHEDIGKLNELKYFNISNNKSVTSFPDSIGNLRLLEGLYVQDNHLIALPNSIGNLESLISLNVRFNNIKFLPESIGNLKSLEYLGLTHNQLEYVPESIGEMISLKNIEFTGNPLKTLPGTIEKLSCLEFLGINKESLDKDSRKLLKRLQKKGIRIHCHS